ncbi:glycosyltransferase [Saccharopolyspora erythraea]|uniref:glycosyltransferase n=1 Tax=Saccharopolyspora erythraea TaxID=1836 RepID=UPI002012C6B2|nr:glycosyltransferase [Saccharopolyspora erythraea]
MRIAILSFGTRGDVAPFTGLGARLREAGHEVVVGVHDSFAPMVRDAGLEHRPLAADARALLAGEAGKRLRDHGSGVRGIAEQLRHAGDFTETMNELGESVVEAARDADLLLLQSASRPSACGAGSPSCCPVTRRRCSSRATPTSCA